MHVTVTDQAIDAIKAMIARGELAAGDRLPNEEIFAEQLGLSRNSLREAMRALIAMGILVSKQGDGTYVSSLEPHVLLESLAFAADVSSSRGVSHMLQVRRMLEPQATALAAVRVSDADIAALQGCIDRTVEEMGVEDFITLDMEFHRRIIDLVGNPVLSMLLEILAGRTVRTRVLRGTRIADAQEVIRREHQAILDALILRDPQLAAAAAAMHVAGVERWAAEQAALSGGAA
ncbi:GntR family transcriptional regulator [Longispora fulva]|nr:GntR family transcriptional regulator [Longispora fulva]